VPLRVLIGGVAYGQGNVGDEAILEGILRDLEEVRGEIEVSVLTWRPQSTAERLGVRGIKVTTTSPLRAVLDADLVICGGASIFAPYWPQKEPLGILKGYPLYPSVFTLWARLLGKPTMIYAAGVEPLRLRWMQRVVAFACRCASAVTVRDPASATLLEEWGAPRGKALAAADPAFSLRPASNSGLAEDFMRRQGIASSSRPLVGLSLAYEPEAIKRPQRLAAFFAQAADYIAEELQATPVFIPMNTTPEFDHWVMSEAIRTMRRPEEARLLSGDYAPSELLAFLAHVDLVISTRMHLLILAMVAGTPFLAVSRGPKIDSLVERIGAEVFARTDELDFPALAGRLRSAWARRDELRADQAAGLASLRAAGEANRRLILGLVRGRIGEAHGRR